MFQKLNFKNFHKIKYQLIKLKTIKHASEVKVYMYILLSQMHGYIYQYASLKLERS